MDWIKIPIESCLKNAFSCFFLKNYYNETILHMSFKKGETFYDQITATDSYSSERF